MPKRICPTSLNISCDYLIMLWPSVFRIQVFVEFENASQRCSWVQVYDEGVKAVLVEDSIVWANRSDTTGTTGAPASTTPWPALVSASLDSRSKQDALLPAYTATSN